jgi:hypothetical protein
MSALTSLLVRDRIVPVSKIEEALQSQVFLGGDIEVILLEMSVVPEDVLSAYRAALFDLLPATREEVMKASREALRQVPRDLARSLGIVPMHYEGGTLVVAAWEPLYSPRLSEVEAQLGCELSVRIVNQARLAAGLAHHYAFELDPRLRRLAEALRRRDPGVVPFVRPAAAASRPFGARRQSEDDEPAPDGEEEMSGSLQSSSALAEAYSEAEAQGVSQELLAEAEVPQVAQLPEVAEVAGPAEPASSPELSVEEPLPPGVSPQLAELVARSIPLERAAELLRHATQRDDVLFVLMRYVQQFFDLVCIFSLAKDGARARMAHGAGVARDDVQHAFVPVARAGLFAQVMARKQPVVGHFGSAPEEQTAAALLRRSGDGVGLLIPVTLNGRVVLLLYVDRVRPGIAVEDAAVVQPLLPEVVDALKRLILENKRRGSQPPPPDATPSHDAPSPSGEPTPAQPTDEGPGFSAVDLDTFERLARNEAGWEVASRSVGKAAPAGPVTRDAAPARERLPGVPRAAPPPPAYELSAAAPRVQNGYRARVANAAAEPPIARAEVDASAGNGAARESPEQPAALVEAGRGRARLSLVEASADVPSVIIDMGESVDTLVEQLLQAPPGGEPPQVAELLNIGESVLPVLMQRFPGPLWFDRSKPFKRRPRGRDVSALACAIVAFGDPAAPYLASIIGSSDPDRCFYALMVAGEIVHSDLIDPVARRVLDRDDALRLLALEVLRGYSALPQYDVVMRAIAELSERPGKDSRRQRLAVEALGELRDQRGLRTLIARLADRDEQVVQAAHRALVVLTGQDFGLSPRKWESWSEGWGRAHRVEWLIESLLHPDEGVRTLAGEELKQLTQQYFGYHPALPRRDRELAQRKYREWWELEGRLAMFASGLAH